MQNPASLAGSVCYPALLASSSLAYAVQQYTHTLACLNVCVPALLDPAFIHVCINVCFDYLGEDIVNTAANPRWLESHLCFTSDIHLFHSRFRNISD